jgi:hypothetical protein
VQRDAFKDDNRELFEVLSIGRDMDLSPSRDVTGIKLLTNALLRTSASPFSSTRASPSSTIFISP